MVRTFAATAATALLFVISPAYAAAPGPSCIPAK